MEQEYPIHQYVYEDHIVRIEQYSKESDSNGVIRFGYTVEIEGPDGHKSTLRPKSYLKEHNPDFTEWEIVPYISFKPIMTCPKSTKWFKTKFSMSQLQFLNTVIRAVNLLIQEKTNDVYAKLVFQQNARYLEEDRKWNNQ